MPSGSSDTGRETTGDGWEPNSSSLCELSANDISSKASAALSGRPDVGLEFVGEGDCE